MTTKTKIEMSSEIRNLDAAELDIVTGGLIAGDGGCIPNPKGPRRPFPCPFPPIQLPPWILAR